MLRDAASFGDLGRPPLMKFDRSTVSGRSVVTSSRYISPIYTAPARIRSRAGSSDKFRHPSILAVPLIREGRDSAPSWSRRPRCGRSAKELLF